MQVIINKSLLQSRGDISVYCTFDDDADVHMSDFPDGSMVLRVPNNAVYSMMPGGMMLSGDWLNENKQSILSSEGEQRIKVIFPESLQLASIHELLSLMMAHGTDQSKWPSTAQKRKSEIDRCWAYVNSVRAKVKQLCDAELSGAPTQNSIWPPRIAPYT